MAKYTTNFINFNINKFPICFINLFILLAVISYSNIFLLNIFAYFSSTFDLNVDFTYDLYTFIFLVLLSPICEEIYKYINIKNKRGSEFLLTLVLFEYIKYVYMLYEYYYNIFYILFIRIFPIICHYTTAIIIRHGIENDYKKEKGLLLIATIIHIYYNLIVHILFLKGYI